MEKMRIGIPCADFSSIESEDALHALVKQKANARRRSINIIDIVQSADSREGEVCYVVHFEKIKKNVNRPYSVNEPILVSRDGKNYVKGIVTKIGQINAKANGFLVRLEEEFSGWGDSGKIGYEMTILSGLEGRFMEHLPEDTVQAA